MKIKNRFEDHGARFYTVELEEDVFIDVKCLENLCYVMQCEDGYEAYNSDGNTFDYSFSENEVLEFVKNHM